MLKTFSNTLAEMPLGPQLQVLFAMVEDFRNGSDDTLRALKTEADAIGARLLVVGGVAVIVHGYGRTTTDRDVLVGHRDAPRLADRLMDHPDWERLEIRQYAFLYRPNGMQVDFLVSGDLVQWGRPYRFPSVDEMEALECVEGLPVVGLHDLLYLKLLAGRMRDMGDIMELCKLHLAAIDTERVVGRLQPEDSDLREKFLNVLKLAPEELANERRLGQGLRPE